MSKIKEGTLYKKLIVHDKAFDILYGYYCDAERGRWDPTPIYPDFIKNPEYTKKGLPIVTAEQTVCERYTPKKNTSGEEWCNDCTHFKLVEEIIGVCQSPQKRKKENDEQK